MEFAWFANNNAIIISDFAGINLKRQTLYFMNQLKYGFCKNTS